MGLAVCALLLGTSLSLAGCGTSTVAKGEADAQAIPAPVPEVIAEEPVEELTGAAAYDLTPLPGEWPTTKVALLLPLTGRHAGIGQALLNAAQLALFDIADDRFALVVRDTGGTAEGARLAVQSALEERVGLVLGPLFGSSVPAVAGETRFVGINLIAFSNDYTVAGDMVFIAGLPPREQIARIIDYASRQGLRRFAILTPRTTYGEEVMQAARGIIQRQGAELVRIVTYGAAAVDVTAEIRALGRYDERREALLAERAKLEAIDDEASQKALERLSTLDTLGAPDFEALLLPAGGRDLLSIAPSLAYYDVDPGEVRFLGTALWNDPNLGTEPTLVGGWFAAPTPALWENFRRRYQETYDAPPPRVATLAYDLVALGSVLARTSAGPGQAADFSFTALTQPSGFSGIDGIFRFTETGVVERGLAVLEMSRDSLSVLEDAPQSFKAYIN